MKKDYIGAHHQKNDRIVLRYHFRKKFRVNLNYRMKN